MSEGDKDNEDALSAAYSALGRYRASRRRTDVPGICAYCGKEFLGYTSQAYCSIAHKQAAYRQRVNDKKQEGSEVSE